MQNNVCPDIFWYGDILLHVRATTTTTKQNNKQKKQKKKNQICIYTKYMENLWGDETKDNKHLDTG